MIAEKYFDGLTAVWVEGAVAPMTECFDDARILRHLTRWAYALASLLFCDRTNGLPVVAAAVVPVVTVGIEVHVVRAARVARIEGR